MPWFFCRLTPPRPSFALDMTEAEQGLMGEHAAYWQTPLQEGKVAIFGVVGDPSGPFGVGVIDLPDEDAAHAFTAADPVVRSEQGFSYDVFVMPNAVTPG